MEIVIVAFIFILLLYLAVLFFLNPVILAALISAVGTFLAALIAGSIASSHIEKKHIKSLEKDEANREAERLKERYLEEGLEADLKKIDSMIAQIMAHQHLFGEKIEYIKSLLNKQLSDELIYSNNQEIDYLLNSESNISFLHISRSKIVSRLLGDNNYSKAVFKCALYAFKIVEKYNRDLDRFIAEIIKNYNYYLKNDGKEGWKKYSYEMFDKLKFYEVQIKIAVASVVEGEELINLLQKYIEEIDKNNLTVKELLESGIDKEDKDRIFRTYLKIIWMDKLMSDALKNKSIFGKSIDLIVEEIDQQAEYFSKKYEHPQKN